MTAPAFTIAEIRKIGPCDDPLILYPNLPPRKKITLAMAATAGVSLDDLLWTVSVLSKSDKDIERRLRLWMADCASHVLHIYERVGDSSAPRNAIEVGRQFACGEVDAAARAAARAAAAGAAAGDAERDWQNARLIVRFSNNEPDDCPLSAIPKRKAA